jgi:hypothetical protein
MKRSLALFLTVALLLITAHRLPAPITEIPESPTPAPANPTPSPEEQTKPKKSSPKPKAKPAESEVAAKTPARSSSTSTSALQGPAKFAGTWTGSVTQSAGTSKISLLVNATATSVTVAGRARPAIANGSAISWKSGMTNSNDWTLTPNSDGKSAQVTVHDWLLGEWSATFYRDQGSQVSANATTSTLQQTEPTAKPVPEKPGFVYNPFDPNGTMLLDVRGKASGSRVKEPLFGKIFIVP